MARESLVDHLKDVQLSPSVEAVLSQYRPAEHWVGVIRTRFAHPTSPNYFSAVEVDVSGHRYFFELPYELRDMSPDRQKLPHETLMGWQNIPKGARIAFVPLDESLAKSAGYDGSINSIVQLPITAETIGYATDRPIEHMRGTCNGKDLRDMDKAA